MRNKKRKKSFIENAVDEYRHAAPVGEIDGTFSGLAILGGKDTPDRPEERREIRLPGRRDAAPGLI